MFIRKLPKLFFIFILVSFVACFKKENDLSTFTKDDQKLVVAIKTKYSLDVFDKSATSDESSAIFAAAQIASKYYQKLQGRLLQNSLRLYTNTKENVTVALVSFSNNPDKFMALKGKFINDKFVILKELLFIRHLTSKGNGRVLILNGTDALEINSVNGYETISSFSLANSEKMIFNIVEHGGAGFCQREQGESFSNCYKAEKDEFCDGFWSCLAVDTQPQVMLLIAAACSCTVSAQFLNNLS